MQVIITQEAVKKGLDKAPEVSDRIELSRQSILIDAYIQDYIKSNPVSDAALQPSTTSSKPSPAGNEYKARHILVDSEAEAKELIAKLNKNPKAFAALANAKSKDRGSKANGGDLGCSIRAAWFRIRRGGCQAGKKASSPKSR